MRRHHAGIIGVVLIGFFIAQLGCNNGGKSASGDSVKQKEIEQSSKAAMPHGMGPSADGDMKKTYQGGGSGQGGAIDPGKMYPGGPQGGYPGGPQGGPPKGGGTPQGNAPGK